ncbi:MAG: cell division protein FtsK [Verrucomicrobia bacterium]|nr:MAG: cell division protein FtsK [Verrucomicrobiota bacterium]
MARKASAEAHPSHGWGDVIGVALAAGGLLLLVAQLTFDRYDLSFYRLPPNHPPHNWIGPLGAHCAHASFFMLGFTAYMVPMVMAALSLGYWFESLAYLKRRWPWALVLLVSCMGWLQLLDKTPFFSRAHEAIGAHSIGGLIGDKIDLSDILGRTGSAVIYGSLDLISLLFLTNFRLRDFFRSMFGKQAETDATEEELVLERKARDLKKQAKDLQEHLERSGLGQDLQPVPAPTVRDLSVPQPKPGRAKKPERSADSTVRATDPAKRADEAVRVPGQEPAPADEGEVIPAAEVAAATTADVLGKKAANGKASDTKTGAPESEKSDQIDGEAKGEEKARPEPQVHFGPIGSTKKAKKPKPITVASTPMIGNYRLPPLDLLQQPDPTIKPTESKEELLANARLMQQTLAQFEIPVELGDITKGPTITRYELHPAPGVKLEKITALNNNLAAALKAERIHILAPVPGKSSVGIEVPNMIKTKVILRDLLESDEWRNTKAKVPLALGKDVYGHPIVSDLSEMPHLLIAGSTGSGKSVCINAIITSLLYRFSPDQLRFVMIDPKVVELQQYNVLPHLVVPVVTDPKKVVLALRWVINEMEKRYQIFARVGVRNIGSFNTRPKHKPLPKEPELPLMPRKDKEPGAEGFAVEVDEKIIVPRDEDIVIPERLSYIVVIIDELADLMLVAPAEVEMAIARITQMARAAGIHCIVATQRPSVDVITGVIKANIPARIAFQVAAKVDSRTILDAMGADKLLGKGDLLYLPPGSAKLIRAQGSLITDQEIQSIVDFIALQGKPSYEMEIHQQLSKPDDGPDGEGGIDEDEEVIQDCIEVIRSEQKASVSLLQRRLRLGYGRAARIMDELENRGIVGPSKGAEPRDILIDLDGTGADGRPKE